MFLVKYNSAGDVVWAKSGGGVGFDISESVATDALGNIYITGYYQSHTINFGTFSLTSPTPSAVFLVKYDSSGNVVWAQGSTGNYTDYAYSVHTDIYGYVYIVGQIGSSLVTFGSVSLTNTMGAGMFIVKYDADGNAIWGKSAVGDGSNNATCITNDAMGNSYVCGWFDGMQIKFGADSILNDNVGIQDMFLVKYDTAGVEKWVKGVKCNVDVQATTVVAGDSGKIYIAGNFGDSLKFEHDTLLSIGGTDMFFAKFDTTGNFNWAKPKSSCTLIGL